MRYYFLIFIAFLLLSCGKIEQNSGDNYRIIISNIVDGECYNDTIEFIATKNQLDSISYFVFMQRVIDYDFTYYNILYAPLSKKLEIAYPFNYLTINANCDTILQDTLLSSKAIHRRLENDYWGRMWYKAQGLKEPEKKLKEKSKSSRKSKKIEPKRLDPVPKPNFNHHDLPNPPQF